MRVAGFGLASLHCGNWLINETRIRVTVFFFATAVVARENSVRRPLIIYKSGIALQNACRKENEGISTVHLATTRTRIV